MDVESHGTAGPPPDDGADVHRLGPPGWEEFAAARRRFETSLKVLGLERAWSGRAAEAPDGRPAGTTRA